MNWVGCSYNIDELEVFSVKKWKDKLKKTTTKFK